MPDRFPALWVDHVSIAVRAIGPALDFLRRYLPVEMHVEPRPGYDDQFVWGDFFIGDWKLELIESARSDSFVERFLARRGEGFHHISINVEEGALDGVRYRVDHVAVAVRSIDETLAWFRRAFPIDTPHPKRPGWDGTHNLLTFWLAGFKMELLEPAQADGPIGRFLTERGQGFHHLTIDVDDLDRVLARLKGDGVRVVGLAEPRRGYRTAFIHPHDAHGVLIQFWQEPEFGGPRRR